MSADRVVILTALNVEYDAVHKRLSRAKAHWHPAGTRFETGRLRPTGCRAVLALVGKGNQAAAVLAERAIAEFAPSAVLFVGVAGALRDGVGLGDVVVASHVYSYHGGRAEDDGVRARPRSWEISHPAAQLAQHLIRAGGWLPGTCPKVHFGPIAAGEVVHDSRVSEQARWVRQHYNDALAIEMEAAGVAQAGHLNRSLPVVVIRGVSDLADGSKKSTDGEIWQVRAADHAAAFAAVLAQDLVIRPDNDNEGEPSTNETRRTATFSNIATGNARVGAQFGQVNGNVSLGASAPAGLSDPAADITALRSLMTRAHHSGRLDDLTYAAAQEELDAALGCLDDYNTAVGRNRIAISLKKLHGLVGDDSELAARVSEVISTLRSAS
ncbi:5'-methylthioadenosine/S-adenosylhomocysteine nucleosidase [Actinoplanes sp. TBRC 11911]|uniref:5'-methylthioadenosine/S-adenosylhomocysteine nucleosidase family protein n=1 Tax=Actinoplanes sp. TBRC 11911 TaxID=2729386 RepID=UPI00145E5D44|nr:5'-methylthioadenosine/S-adenosylhomocysteine nucleosidase [Actinoplanes sp. TBRC 11911]NMO57578.1 5'-methylthioadenosine/S-adenosylhomocysteine nucleosidase [Actinoplanes sp. TBRC 11911]